MTDLQTEKKYASLLVLLQYQNKWMFNSLKELHDAGQYDRVLQYRKNNRPEYVYKPDRKTEQNFIF